MKDCIEKLLQQEPRVPTSTYRVQMHAHFTFENAQAIVPYLKELGIGDFYSSPFFEARPGSMHGYDVTRHDRLNPELGGSEEFERFSASLKSAGLGLLLDIVPNHMGIGNDSRWWQDVLENGRASEFAAYFDIDWDPAKPDMWNKLLLPILGKQYGEELESKNIQVHIENGRAFIKYFDHIMPVAPRMIPKIFPESKDAEYGVPRSFRDLLKDLSHIPPHEATDPSLVAQRRAQLLEIRPRLEQALRSTELQPVIARALEAINGVEGDPKSFDQLHDLLESQPYRLAFWRVSGEEINYRRFFDVNDLAGLRMENPAVFAETHCLIRDLLGKQQLTGLRVDHADGMFNPRQYLIRLQLLYVASQCAGPTPTGPTGTNGIEDEVRDQLRGYDWAKGNRPLYCVVEKILEPGEALPREWPVNGTSGYDFIYFANQLFIQLEHEEKFNRIYEEATGSRTSPDEIIYRSKLQVMQTSLASEVYVLTNLLNHIAVSDRSARDFTENILESVIRETIACFPVYRTYIDDRGQYTPSDRQVVERAIQRAKRLNSGIDASAFDFLQNTLLLGGRPGHPQSEIDAEQLYFALKFQQLTGPVMAKGVEDTSFYVYNRFLSSNEVGGSMKAFGITPEVFHGSNQNRLQNSPDAMLTLSTHDTKRSEDVRARLNVLSEMPSEWASLVRRLRRASKSVKRKLSDGRIAPDANEEYMLYQNILGVWPWQIDTDEARQDFLKRIQEYSSKALSESKVNLSWLNPNPEYIEAVHAFLADALTPDKRGKDSRFVQLFNTVLPRLKFFGAINSLAQTVLKLISPGVPDFYQGAELWELSLVDPDNRRPVDYEMRSSLLHTITSLEASSGALAVCQDVLTNLPDGRVKLWVAYKALGLRNDWHNLFRKGDYVPLQLIGTNAKFAIAFLRSFEGHSVLTVIPRFANTLMHGKTEWPLNDVWGDSRIELPENTPRLFTNIFTGKQVLADESGLLSLSTVFEDFPVAVLTSEG
ncbi:malto-oligosyltrehalose synthase [Acidisarcina polymorpha]|nr:malto-oligosyltrehalose synthase [Acidisarcina polymorpha]